MYLTFIPRSSASFQRIDGYNSSLEPFHVIDHVLTGVIQGSEESLSHEHRHLDKATYEKLSHRTQHTFANRRNVVYSIFTTYLKHKKSSNEYDAADRYVYPTCLSAPVTKYRHTIGPIESWMLSELKVSRVKKLIFCKISSSDFLDLEI